MLGRENQGSSGFMVLQDHDTSWPLETREWRGACRMYAKDKYGRRKIEPGTAGDIICSTLWKPDSREQCAWANVFPTLSLGTKGDAGIGPSGENGDPNVGAPGGKGEGGAAGPAGPGGAGGPGGYIAADGSRRFGVRPSTSVDPFAGRGGTVGGSRAGSVDVGASIFTNGVLRWTNAAREKRAEVTKYSKKWWEQQRKNKAAGAAGGVGENGVGGVAGGNGPTREPVITGDKAVDVGPRTVGMLPILDEGHAVDRRFSPSGAILPDYWPSFPEGVVGLRVGGTDEQSQQEVWVPTDPRLFAVNKSPKGIMGSLVYDLEPDGKVAVGQGLPGVVGRGARLQTMMRVVRLPANPAHLEIAGVPCGNVIAWQGARTGQEGWPGLGAYTTVTAKGDTRSGSGEGDVAGYEGAMPSVSDLTNVAPGHLTPGGSLQAPPANQPVCAFADHTAFGPFHGGFGADKHRIDQTLDGEKMHPVHISTLAYFAKTQEKDAPLFFEDLPYNANNFPLAAKVHLVYDATESHPFFSESRQGWWKWWAEVPYMPSGGEPPVTPPSDPPERPPGDRTPPSTPRPPGDITPPAGPLPPVDIGPPSRGSPPPSGGSAPVPSGVSETQYGSKDYLTWTPNTWGMGGIAFRPQHFAPRVQDFRRGGYTNAQAIAENAQRPVVLRVEAFGKQAGHSWGYSRRPSASRYAGGEAAGGIVFLAAPVDMADSRTSWAPTDRSMPDAYVLAGPSVHFAWGTPDTTTGAPGDGGYRASLSSGSLLFQRYSSSAWSSALSIVSDANGVGVAVGGSAYLSLPSGTTGTRPASPANGMLRYNTDTGRAEARVHGDWHSLGIEPDVEAFTADDTLTATETGRVCHNTGASGTVVLDLPQAVTGRTFTLIVGAAFNFTAEAVGGDTIQDASTSGTTITANAVGEVVTLFAIGTIWYVTSVTGSWTVAP